jgi:hypothetical protein
MGIMKVLLLLAPFLFFSNGHAEEEIDTAIKQKLEFFSQMEVIKNLDVAENLENYMKDTSPTPPPKEGGG